MLHLYFHSRAAVVKIFQMLSYVSPKNLQVWLKNFLYLT